MEYREIAKTGIKVSEISLGCWTLGGLNWVDGQANGWADVDEAEVKAAIKSALDQGVNHFDNADVYGNGRAERLLAKTLTDLGIQNTKLIISSKVGHFPGTAEHAYEPAHLRHQLEQSLINLKRDYIDIYYFHHGNFGDNDFYLDEALQQMLKFKEEGKIRALGLSAYSEDDFQRLVPKIKPAVLQSWAHALDNHFIESGSPVSSLLEKYQMSFVAFSPLAQARLLDKYDPQNPPCFDEGDVRKSNPAFSAKALAELKPKLQKLKERFGSRTEDLAAMALRYILNHKQVACVIPGFRNQKQVDCNLGAAKHSLNQADMDFIAQTLKNIKTTF